MKSETDQDYSRSLIDFLEVNGDKFDWVSDANAFAIPDGLALHDMFMVNDQNDVYLLQEFRMVFSTRLNEFDFRPSPDQPEISRSLAQLILTHRELNREIDFVPLDIDIDDLPNFRSVISGTSDDAITSQIEFKQDAHHTNQPDSPEKKNEFRNRIAVAIRAFRESRLKESEWASAVGPVYSIEGFASALGLKSSEVIALSRSSQVLSFDTVDGDQVFPAGQIDSGRVLRGIPWLLGELNLDLVDRYSLAIWLNQSREELNGRSIWDDLRGEGKVLDSTRSLVARFKTSLLAR